VFVRPYRVRMALGILSGLGFGLAGAALALALKVVIDTVFPSDGTSLIGQELSKLPGWAQELVRPLTRLLPRTEPGAIGTVLMVSTVPLAMFIRGLCAYLNYYLMNWVAIRGIMDLRHQLFAHLQGLSLEFYHGSSTGDLISRISNDTNVLHKTISVTLPTMIKDPISAVIFVGVLFWQQPNLTAVSLVVIPACVVPIIVYGRKVRKSSAALQTNFSELTTLMEETFTGMRIVKAYNLEATVLGKFSENTRKYIAHFMRVVRSSEIPGALTEFLGGLGVALVILYTKLIVKTPMTAGDLTQFAASVFLMYQPIKAVSRLPGQLEQARAASERVFELLDLRPTVVEPPHPVPLHANGADISFDRINFNYGEKHILRDIQLVVKCGQHVALVGASGAGKTTMTNLLLRFYDPSDGAVRIGQTDIRQTSVSDLRSQMAVVTQETILFNDTIRQNIAYGRPGATYAEIENAARQAHAHEFILQKPHGYDAMVGEKGVTLSGGQRQRIAIARAILKNAPILILDEATSALDTESERTVQEALAELMRGRTTLSIAHRISTIQSADLIVVMAEGRILEQGRHEDLVVRSGPYQRLYQLQFAV